MTPTSKSPWPAPAATATDQANQLDTSPQAIIERDQAIADGIRRGLIGENFSQRCRRAVASGIAAGLVKPANPSPL